MVNPDDADDITEIDVVYTSNYDHDKTYQSLVFEFAQFGENWTAGGNITWSSLEGKSVIDANGSPGSTSQFGNYAEVQNLDFSYVNGPLPGDAPLRIRAWFNYNFNFGRMGNLNVGLLGRFTSGTPYSMTSAMNGANDPIYDPDNPAHETTNGHFGWAPGANSGWTWFHGGTRGQGRLPAVYGVDLSLRWDVKLWNKLSYYVKIDVINVFNDKRLTGYDTTTNGTGSYYWDITDQELVINAPTVSVGSNFGQATNAGHYTGVRQLFIATGLRW